MAKRRQRRSDESGPKIRFSIGEWYGKPITSLSLDELNNFGRRGTKKSQDLCPFMQASLPGTTCNKKGGVCSFRPYRETAHGFAEPILTSYGLVTLCPRRFWADNLIFHWIGESILNCRNPVLITEVPFLRAVTDLETAPFKDDTDAPPGSREATDARQSVGKIDMVLVNPSDHRQWCAVELQAVYFSGPKVSSELTRYATATAPGILFPEEIRRPDFRSSGPKRLMPQLQIKVPTLRRWGKKMVVVVDEAFFTAMAPMKQVGHLSNADIAWCVVQYDPDTGAIHLSRTVYTTLESSVEGLTAGIPITLPEFETELEAVLQAKKSPKKITL